MAAMKFSMLNKEIKRVIQFDISQALSFEGESGPYLQYVYTRCRSIMRKAKVERVTKFDGGLLKVDTEYHLVKMLARFPEVVEEISSSYKINNLPRYLLDLAQMFNQYYQSYKVVQPDKELMNARLALVEGVSRVIQQGLDLLGIKTVEEM